MNKKTAKAIADSLWLTGCHPKPVDQPVLLAALCDQGRDGHHVSEQVLALRALAGVMPQSGYALVMRSGSWGSANEPPGGTIRSNGKFDVLFYAERDHPQHKEEVETLPDVTGPIRSACKRWGTESGYERGTLFFPWGSSSAKRAGEGRLGAVVHHASMFRIGLVSGVVALAAGRLGDAVLGIAKTRWMFDVPSKRKRRLP